MAETWSLRVTFQSATKTFDGLDPASTVGDLCETAATAFRAKHGLDLAGGFPPRALDAAATLRDAASDKASLRGSWSHERRIGSRSCVA